MTKMERNIRNFKCSAILIRAALRGIRLLNSSMAFQDCSKSPRFLPYTFLFCLFCLISSGCGSGGQSGVADNNALDATYQLDGECDGSCPQQNLEIEDVNQILKQAVAAAEQLGVAATFAVLDRVGNVLAVYQMLGATSSSVISGQIGANGGLENLVVPATLAAISKAGTGAYLSSQANAFSTRTASQIIQENFNPGEGNQPGGPLFGVQFSQLICSDVMTVNPDFNGGVNAGRKLLASGLLGPRPLPLGLSADPGGIPIYKLGSIVGGIGVELDGSYTLDRDISDFDDSLEERIALSATTGYEIPESRTGRHIFVAGKQLRTTDLFYDDLDPLPDPLPELNFDLIQAVPFYSNGEVRSGATFGSPESGVADTVRVGVASAILVDSSGNPRFPTKRGSALPNNIELTAQEVDALLDSTMLTATRARAGIRRPLDSPARVSVWVVDTLGTPLGMVRGQDAPLFGIDVALQKARTAAFFSAVDASQMLNALRTTNSLGGFDDYVSKLISQFGFDPLQGKYAFSVRAIGNISRPFFADGINASNNGPLSLPFPNTDLSARTWSPFNVGLALDLIFERLANSLGIPQNPPASIPDSCVNRSVTGDRLVNGIQIFPGGVPLYRNGVLIGGLGVSGDGVDQDDLVAFFGASRTGLDYAGHFLIGDPILGLNAPKEIRSDTLISVNPDIRLRYVNCPEAPFRGENVQKVCSDL